MRERYLRQSFLPEKNRVLALIIIVHCLLLISAGSAHSQESAKDYFYLQEEELNSSRNSCANIFGALKKGTEDVGGVIKSLKAINVNYLLGDYDNSLSSDRRKVNYLKLDDLMREVEENKREIYCRIELAIYMKNDDSFAGPAYDMLLAEAFLKLEETYASAQKSLQREDIARAIYGFDLIAPYHDSYEMSLKAATMLQESSGEKIATITDAEDQTAESVSVKTLGPIAVAASRSVGSDEAADTVTAGPIVLASRLGPISQAVKMMPVAVWIEDGEIQ